jgi:deazaflavin-dependent oxidoreductase (nitroreductase family)
MLLTTRDRKTGEPRTVPVFYLRDGHNLVATYENFESAGGGGWPGNLRADPRVTIQIGSTVTSYRARPATAEETDRTMQELLFIWPAYDTYLQRSDTRQVIVFEPLHGSVHRPSAAGIEWLRPDVGGLDEAKLTRVATSVPRPPRTAHALAINLIEPACSIRRYQRIARAVWPGVPRPATWRSWRRAAHPNGLQ